MLDAPLRPYYATRMSESKRADRLLVELGHFESRARARAAIEAGAVVADGSRILKPATLLRADAAIKAAHPHPYVSRGGIKLEAALSAFGFNPAGCVCLDVGAATGGFTQLLLLRGARKVVAVDVGHGQLHASLVDDPRLKSLEGQDIRTLAPAIIGEAPTFVTIDVSFISLLAVLPAIDALTASSAALIALIKPQYEAGRAHHKKGIVRDPKVQSEVRHRVETALRDLRWTVVGVVPSPIAGGDGNREFLIGARRG
jgi:23S rRNA (cytidine1920-2'-O)/16S rRNA (cytidine1409-2'-O)-methyltransferase